MGFSYILFGNAAWVTHWIRYPCWKWYTVCPLWYVSGFDPTLFWAVRLVGEDDALHVLHRRDGRIKAGMRTHSRFGLQAKCFKLHCRWLVTQYHHVSSCHSCWQLSDKTRLWTLQHGDQTTALLSSRFIAPQNTSTLICLIVFHSNHKLL